MTDPVGRYRGEIFVEITLSSDKMHLVLIIGVLQVVNKSHSFSASFCNFSYSEENLVTQATRCNWMVANYLCYEVFYVQKKSEQFCLFYYFLLMTKVNITKC